MGLETGTYIDSLVITNPTATDNRSEGDDHLRLIKSTIKATFPNISGAVNLTHTELNYVDGVTSAIQTQLDAKVSTTSDLLKGTWRLIKTQTASSSSTIDFINGVSSVVLDSTYDIYMVRLSAIVLSASSVPLRLRTTTNASTFGTSDYSFQTSTMTNGVISSGYAETAGSAINLTGTIGTAFGPLHGELMIYLPSSAAPLQVRCNSMTTESTPVNTYGYDAYGVNKNVADVDGIRFFADSGVITSGTFALYGLVK